MSKTLLFLTLAMVTLAAHAARVVTDETGRRVTLPDHPHRVVCLVPSITDTVFALGSGDDVVAVSDYTTYPPEALKKPSIGGLIRPSVETILSFHPDLVLGTSMPGAAETATQLQTVGIPVYLVDPHGLSGILRSVSSVGEALNRGSQAIALNTSLSRRIAAVRAHAAGKSAPRVLVPVWYDPIITVGKNAFISEIVETAGAKSVTDDLVPDWPQVSMEAVISRAPQALVLIRGGKISIQTLENLPGWSSLPAIQSGKVYWVENGIQEPSPVAIHALEELAQELHP